MRGRLLTLGSLRVGMEGLSSVTGQAISNMHYRTGIGLSLQEW